MEEKEEMTVLSLGIGATSENSKSSSSGWKPKSLVQSHELFPGQLLGKTDHKLVALTKECKTAKKARRSSFEDQ